MDSHKVAVLVLFYLLRSHATAPRFQAEKSTTVVLDAVKTFIWILASQVTLKNQTPVFVKHN